MIVSEIKLYELLKAKLGTQEAEAFVEILEKKVDQKFEESKQMLATKEDIAKLEGKLETKIAETKADMIKWMFIFWIGQMAATVAIVKFFIK
jgi:predicted Holliday junction resolvase-like endonuclease